MAWFKAFRNEYGFAAYRDNRTAVTCDISLVVVTYLCLLVSIATLIATLGIRGRERWSTTIRAMYAVGVGSIILACLVGSGWQEGRVKIKSPYLYRSSLPFEGYVGIKVALNSVNVTLEGNYHGASGSGFVYYAESMPWSEFGHEPESYQFYLQKGLPEPILKVMGFLSVDEGELRWGRSLHASGYYAMALLWTSFAFWIICNVLLCSVIIYGAYMFALTGLTMLLACITYHVCQCQLSIDIKFGDQALTMSYSWSYWLTLTAGCSTFLLGLILIAVDHFAHEGVSEFFHLEKLVDDDVTESDTRRESAKAYIMNGLSEVRRGSIFLDPCRQPADAHTRFIPGSSNVFVTANSELCGRLMKANPVFCGDEETPARTEVGSDDDDDEGDIREEMERVCQNSQICLSTKKPSLATLKEHRDNHANEKLSTTSSSGNEIGKSPPSRKATTRLSFSEDVVTLGCPDKEFYVPCRPPKTNSYPARACPSHVLERAISEASCESDEASHVHKSVSFEVLASADAENDYHEMPTTSSCIQVEPNDDSVEKPSFHRVNEIEMNTASTSDSERGGSSTDVIVHIS